MNGITNKGNKMYKIMFLSFIGLVACGSAHIPCSGDFDEYTDGLCIETNGFPVNMINLSTSIGITERWFNNFYPTNTVYLEDLFIENNITLEFVEYFWGGIKGVTIGEYHDPETGEFKSTTVKIQGSSCLFRNYVTAHELLHVIADHHLNLPIPSFYHTVDHMFFIGALEKNLELDSVMEYYILEEILPLCNLTMEDVL